MKFCFIFYFALEEHEEKSCDGEKNCRIEEHFVIKFSVCCMCRCVCVSQVEFF